MERAPRRFAGTPRILTVWRPPVLIWIALLVLALVLFGVGFFTMPIVWIAAAVLLAVAVFGGGRSRRSSRR